MTDLEPNPKSESTEISIKEDPKPPNPFLSLFQNFKLSFPQLNLNLQPKPETATANGSVTSVIEEKRDVVKFSDRKPIVPPPLKLEVEDSEQGSSRAVQWQIYALGGFIILKWAWARWNERSAKNESSDDEAS